MKTFILAFLAWFLGLRFEYTRRDLELLWNRILCYLYHRYQLWKREWKIPQRTFFVGKQDPYTAGILFPEAEWEIERPTCEKLGRRRDEMFFCGTRTTGECFVMRVSRKRGRCLDLWMYLRMENGDHYELVEHSLLDLSGKEGFAAKGLRIECQAPMRQWRIVFNGLMRSLSTDDASTSNLHVRINFLWKASSHVFDIQANASHDGILDSCLVESLSQTTSNCKHVHQLIDGYEQRGQLMGTVTLADEKEREMYLWGTRQRLKGNVSTGSFTKASHVFGHTKGAQSFHIACYHPNIGYGNSEDVPDMSRFIYGNLQTADGVVDPVTETSSSGLHVLALLEKPSFRITADETHEIQIKDAVTLKRHVAESDGTQLLYIEFTYDGVPGCGLGFLDISSPRLFDAFKLNAGLLTQDEGCPSTVPFVANISDVVCRHTSVAGGKGSSLCLLNAISEENKEVFKVPAGVIVTTAAYDLFLRDGPAKLLQSILQEAQGEKTIEEVTQVSERAMKNISDTALPNELKKQIRDSLVLALDGDIETKRFAVRSSCTGEDTSEMSGAGQLETFLGIRGMEAVYEAVVKCWASQFSPVAIQYKRRYGQLLNSPMAVVIMEMVASDVAGVMFTCDPLSGNPAVTYITANYGLGESVVSGLVESDTISVDKGSNGKMTLEKVTPGAKGSKVIMDNSGGTRTENFVDEENKCSISEGQALQLARIGSIVDRYFGDSRDIEWAIHGESIYLLQARPITSLYEDTEFESMHALDSAHQSEWEFYTKANIGEVVHRGMSPLGSSAFHNLFVPEWACQMKRAQKGRLLTSPYFNKLCPVSHYHSVLDLCEFFHYYAPGGGEAVEHILLSIFGRRIEDKDLEEAVSLRKYSCLTRRRFVNFKTRYTSGLSLKLAWKKYGDFKMPVNSNMSARQLYDCICSHCGDTAGVVSCHLVSSEASSLFNHDVTSALCELMNKSDMDDDVYAALGGLISSCHNPVSVDVPLALECLAAVVSKFLDPKEFAAMTTEQAEKWLRHSGTAASTAFESFLETHGHRGYNECDIHQPTWRMKPTILIKNLQVLVLNIGHKNLMKSHVPLFEAIDGLNLPLSLFQRLRLAYLVEMSRRSVAQRESSKSLLIKAVDALRIAYHQLADKMLQDGFIPERDLLFFMTHHEVGRLLNTRSATILSRAYKRRSVFPKASEIEFPEITRGPIHAGVQEEPQLTDDTTFLKGIPISKGSVEGTARVVTSIDEASTIQRGDILITYATDIGWSPYFTLISGIVTELGGLMSHDLGLLWNRILCYLYLRYLLWNRKWNFPKCTFFVEKKDPYTDGILFPEAEWEIERPTHEKLGRRKDEMFLCGTRTTGECFVMRVSRRRGRCLDLWIYLRMKNGDHYEFVEHSLLDLSGKEGFAAKGLRIECLAPMRQWRIAFNGLMRSPPSDDSSTSSLHVRLNLLWKASSHVVDIQANASHESILEGCLVESLGQTISNCERAYQLIDGYEQRGQLMGTVALGDEKEVEMYLWGTRQRLKGNVTESVTKASHVFGHTRGAQSFHLACYHPNTGYGNSEDAPDMSRFIYGNLQAADGLVDPVTETSPSELHVSALLDRPSFHIRAGETHEIQIKDAVTLKRHVAESDGTQLLYFEFTYDGVPGSGLGFLDISSPMPFETKLNAGLLTQDEDCPSTFPFVANISDVVCRHTSVAGGKGSSLCLLNAISKENKEVFKVPGGVIVTTAAYDLFLRNGPANLLQSILQEAQGEKTIEEVTRVSERAVNNISNMALPNVLKKHIRDALFLALDGDIETKRFAVRSSCTGEDTSEMSGAGQLETFLGVCGMEAVYEAVAKCWASQFSPVAIQYKRRYGQLLNSPMAVVIMEMVASDVAGVMFTCDPRSGNPAVTYITANYGLGESVVSGLVESDTLSVNKGSNGKMTLEKVTPGAKGSKVVMDNSGGTRTENFVDEANKCSVSEGQALQLARIGSIVDRSYGDSRDIEWAIRGENIFLLQARPITSLYEDTEFESMRALDSAHQSEWEFYTKANIGEVMHNGISPLGSSAFQNLFVPEWMCYMKRIKTGRVLMSPYFNKTLPVSHYQNILDLCEFFHYFAPGGGEAVEHILLSIFGRRLEDKELEEAVSLRKYSCLTQRRFVDFKTRYTSGLSLKLAWKRYGNFKVPVNSNMSTRQLYDCISSHCGDIAEVPSCHMMSSMASSLCNHDVTSTLCELMDKSDMDDDVYAALGSLISSCHNPVSVDVPLALECLAEVVSKVLDPKEFAAMTTEF
ncbi:uncharacterized protein LOC135370705 isoform X2 [Ornithodoros turicata]|uniref:uncharacterized protein LOC135370705 isoform X2 n=1 Tax=Ornithodoros turicata TaxID=34597 RepID=UPI00313A38D9